MTVRHVTQADFVLEGQGAGNGQWTTLFSTTGFDFTSAGEVHTFSLSERGTAVFTQPDYYPGFGCLSGYNDVTIPGQNSLEQCKAECVQNADCVSVDWYNDGSVCRLAYTAASSVGDFTSTSQCEYYEIVRRRRTQFGAGIIPAAEDECPVSVLNERLEEVDAACCPPESPCEGQPVPDTCPVDCAIAWVPVYVSTATLSVTTPSSDARPWLQSEPVREHASPHDR